MRTHIHPLCAGCTQDLIRNCRESLGVTPQHPCLIRVVAKLARASQQAGISIDTLMGILRAGVPIPEVIELIHAGLCNQWVARAEKTRRASNSFD
jgi:hypothetical protein